MLSGLEINTAALYSKDPGSSQLLLVKSTQKNHTISQHNNHHLRRDIQPEFNVILTVHRR